VIDNRNRLAETDHGAKASAVHHGGDRGDYLPRRGDPEIVIAIRHLQAERTSS
jgi:hypothetical protein